jgi:hypothetical protein
MAVREAAELVELGITIDVAQLDAMPENLVDGIYLYKLVKYVIETDGRLTL